MEQCEGVEEMSALGDESMTRTQLEEDRRIQSFTSSPLQTLCMHFTDVKVGPPDKCTSSIKRKSSRYAEKLPEC